MIETELEFFSFLDYVKTGNIKEIRSICRQEYINKSDGESTAIHYACNNEQINSLRFLIEQNGDVNTVDKEGWSAIHHMARHGHVYIAKELIYNHCNVEAETKNGWRPIHYASSEGHSKLVKLLIDNHCDIESSTKPGLRALHLAAYSGHLDTLKVLIDHNCDLDPLSKSNKTPLDLAQEQNKDDCVKLLTKALEERKEAMAIKLAFEKKKLKKIIQVLDRSMLTKVIDRKCTKTLLDVILSTRINDIIEALKAKSVTLEEISDWREKKDKRINAHSIRLVQECLLYRSIRHENGSAFDELCAADVVNRDTLFRGPSALETVAEYGRVMFVKQLLSRLTTITETWDRAIRVAQDKGYHKIASIISSRKGYIEMQHNDGYNRLHIAVFDNDPDMIRYLFDTDNVHPDDGEKTIGTALSHACFMKYVECIRQFEEMKVNVNTVDRRKQSPLTIAIDNGMGDNCSYILNNTMNIDARDYMGLSLLEKAVIGGCEKVCEDLLNRKANCTDRIQVYRPWWEIDPDMNILTKKPFLRRLTTGDSIVSLCLKTNATVFQCLYNTINSQNINFQDSEDNTLLHLSASLLLPDVCTQLLSRGADVDIENIRGYTPLVEMVNQYKCDKARLDREEALIITTKVLLDGGSSVFIDDCGIHNLLKRATDCGSERLLLEFVRRVNEIEFAEPSQILVWLQLRYFDLVKEIFHRINDELKNKFVTFDIINESLKNPDIDLTYEMIQHADSTVTSRVINKVLYKTAQLDNVDLFKKLIPTVTSNDELLDYGETLLGCLIKERKIKYCEIILRSNKVAFFVDKRNTKNQSPLHVCIERDVQEVMHSVIIETVVVDDEDCKGFTPLALLLQRLSSASTETDSSRIMTSIKMLINKSANIYKVNSLNRMTILFCTNPTKKSEVETFYNRQVPPRKATSDETACRICRDNFVDCVFECGHSSCMECGLKMNSCPMCRHVPTNPKRLLFVTRQS